MPGTRSKTPHLLTASNFTRYLRIFSPQPCSIRQGWKFQLPSTPPFTISEEFDRARQLVNNTPLEKLTEHNLKTMTKMKRKSASRPRGDDSRRHTSTAENVEMGPIQKRKKKTTNDTKSEVSSSTAALLVSNESNSSSGSSSGRWYNSTRSDTSSTRIICKDDHMRIHESRFSPSKFLSISLNPLPPPQSTTYNFTASSSTFSVVMSCNASPLPDRPMGTTLGFLQGLPTTADSLNKFISIVDKVRL